MGIDDMIGETTFLGACDAGTMAMALYNQCSDNNICVCRVLLAFDHLWSTRKLARRKYAHAVPTGFRPKREGGAQACRHLPEVRNPCFVCARSTP